MSKEQAKIITATDGHQVLFFKDNAEPSGEPELVAMAWHEGTTLRLGFEYDGDDAEAKRQAFFDSLDTKVADNVRGALVGMAG